MEEFFQIHVYQGLDSLTLIFPIYYVGRIKWDNVFITKKRQLSLAANGIILIILEEQNVCPRSRAQRKLLYCWNFRTGEQLSVWSGRDSSSVNMRKDVYEGPHSGILSPWKFTIFNIPPYPSRHIQPCSCTHASVHVHIRKHTHITHAGTLPIFAWQQREGATHGYQQAVATDHFTSAQWRPWTSLGSLFMDLCLHQHIQLVI